MKNILFVLSLSVFLIGCGKQSVVTDSNGYQYKMIKSEQVSSNGQTSVALWQRVKPLDTNRYYTPTLEWQTNTNGTPSFNPIAK